jgi:hypothetical protein
VLQAHVLSKKAAEGRQSGDEQQQGVDEVHCVSGRLKHPRTEERNKEPSLQSEVKSKLCQVRLYDKLSDPAIHAREPVILEDMCIVHWKLQSPREYTSQSKPKISLFLIQMTCSLVLWYDTQRTCALV